MFGVLFQANTKNASPNKYETSINRKSVRDFGVAGNISPSKEKASPSAQFNARFAPGLSVMELARTHPLNACKNK
jgi:hypothetical protein